MKKKENETTCLPDTIKSFCLRRKNQALKILILKTATLALPSLSFI